MFKKSTLTVDKVVDGLRFRSITPKDKEPFMALRMEASDMARAYQLFPEFADYDWEQTLKDKKTVSMMVYDAASGSFIAACTFQEIHSSSVYLGYDVVKEHRGQGLGTKVAKALIQLAHELFPSKEILIRIRQENLASRRVAEKNGARLIRRENTPEAQLYQSYVDKYLNEPGGGGINLSELMESAERGKDAILVYKA